MDTPRPALKKRITISRWGPALNAEERAANKERAQQTLPNGTGSDSKDTEDNVVCHIVKISKGSNGEKISPSLNSTQKISDEGQRSPDSGDFLGFVDCGPEKQNSFLKVLGNIAKQEEEIENQARLLDKESTSVAVTDRSDGKGDKMTVDIRPDEDLSEDSMDKSTSDNMEIDENKDSESISGSVTEKSKKGVKLAEATNDDIETESTHDDEAESTLDKEKESTIDKERESIHSDKETESIHSDKETESVHDKDRESVHNDDNTENDKVLDDSESVSVKDDVLSLNDSGEKASIEDKIHDTPTGSENDLSESFHDSEQTEDTSITPVPENDATESNASEDLRKDDAESESTPVQNTRKRSRMSTGGSKSKKQAIDISSPAYLKPFDFGWKRELVYRSTSDTQNRRQSDVYYYTPKGKKVRSFREVLEHLAGQDLTIDNFTFFKEAVGVDDPEKEIIRDAKLKLKDASFGTPSPILKKTLMPKTPTPKAPKPVKVTPVPVKKEPSPEISPAPTVTPTQNTAKSLMPRIVFRGGKRPGGFTIRPKFTATQSKNSVPGQAQKIIISKGKRSRKKSEEELEMGMLPPMWQPNEKATKSKDSASNKSAGTKRVADNIEPTSPAKKLKFDDEYRSHCMQNFVQNMGIGYKALLQAFQYLKVQELLRAGRVCHMWRDIAMHKSLWETVRMKNSRVRDWDGVSQTLRRVGTRHLDLRKIIIPDKSDSLRSMWSDFIKCIAKVNTLVKLDLCRCSSQLIEQVATACPQLECLNALSVRSNELNLTAIGGCKNMTELRLKSVAGVEITNLGTLKMLTKLKHLSLTSIKNLSTDLVEVLNKTTLLETLELGECTKLPEKFITECLPGMTRLRRLRLEKGQGADCQTILLLETISRCPSITQLELINFDVKPGFDTALALCANIKTLLIIPTYVTQSATTNHVVMEGVSKLSKTLTYFVWGLTLELLRVTDLFIDQWEGQKNANKQGTTTHKKSTNDCIPILKPEKDSSSKNKSGSTPLQVDVLQLAKLHKVLMTLLPTTQIKILKVPFSATWRQTIPGSSQ